MKAIQKLLSSIKNKEVELHSNTLVEIIKEAVALSNNSPFDLGGLLFMQEIERGNRLGSQNDKEIIFSNYFKWA